MTFDVITIGSATRDVFLMSNAFKIIRSPEFTTGYGECLNLGSKNPVDNILFTTGGAATNCAVTFARAGIKTAAICRIGDDEAGHEIIKALKQESIETKFVQIDKEKHTAYSTLLLYKGGERTILVYRGVANDLAAEKIPWGGLKTKWVYLSSLGGNANLLSKILSFTAKNKIRVAWNPGGAELGLGLRKLLPYLEKINVLNVNREEAAKLFGLPFDNLEEILTQAKDLPIKYAVITDGIRGAYVVNENKIFYANSVGGKPKNTTGAGDAFGSGFVSGLILGRDIKDALRLGIWNSGLVVQKMGAKAGIWKRLPSGQELNRIKVARK